VSCEPSAVDAVLAVFNKHGFDHAAVVGQVQSAAGAPALVVR